MGKLIRLVLFAIIGLFALVLVASVAIPFLVDANDFKDDIARLVQEKTGRTLELEGNLKLSIFPWLGLELGAAKLSNAPGFANEPFAAIDKAQIRVKLLPLLKKRVEMDTLLLDGLVLNLEKNAKAQTNWADLAGETAESKPQEPAEAGTPGAGLAGFAIGGLQINDARVVWDDRSTDIRYVFSPFSLKTGAVTPGKPVAVDLQVHAVGTKPAIKGDTSFAGDLAVSQDFKQVTIKGADLSVDLSGEGLPVAQIKGELKSDISLDLDAQTFGAENLALSMLGVTLEGRLSGEKILGDARTVSGDFKLKPFSPRKLLVDMNGSAPATSDAAVLNRADAQWALRLAGNSVELSDLIAHLDDTSIEGKLGVSDLQKKAIHFDLAVDQIDADRYLPPPTQSQAATPAQAAAAAPAALPLDALRALNLDGSLKIRDLKAYQLRSQNVEITVTAADGKVRVHPAKAQLYDGAYDGDVGLEVQGDRLRVTTDESLSKVHIGDLLKDMTGKDTVTGTLNAAAKLSGVGATADGIKNSLSGNMALAFADGAVKGVNVVRIVRQAQAVLKGKPYTEKSGAEQTDFSTLTATASVDNGVVRNDDLDAKSPLLRIQGKGMVDLGKQSIDYLLTTTVVGSLEGQGGKELAELSGIPIPIEVSGTFSAPSYKPRLDEALQQVAGAKVKEEVEKKKEEVTQKAQEKLQKKLDKALDGKLKGLFNNY